MGLWISSCQGECRSWWEGHWFALFPSIHMNSQCPLSPAPASVFLSSTWQQVHLAGCPPRARVQITHACLPYLQVHGCHPFTLNCISGKPSRDHLVALLEEMEDKYSTNGCFSPLGSLLFHFVKYLCLDDSRLWAENYLLVTSTHYSSYIVQTKLEILAYPCISLF